MEITATWIAAVASLASALIVAVTAVAAFLQIRHIRNSNEITVFLRLVDRVDSLQAEAAFDDITRFVGRIGTDADLRYRLTQPANVPEAREIASLIQFMEHLSTLVVTGRITEALVLTEYADNISVLWDRLREPIYLRRIALGPYFAATFEHVAMRSKRYVDDGKMGRFYRRLRKDPAMAAFTGPQPPAA